MVTMRQVVGKDGKPSTSIDRAGYDIATRTLAIHFHNGKTYHYQDVPADLAAQFEAAESKGSFLAKHIRGKFSHESHEA